MNRCKAIARYVSTGVMVLLLAAGCGTQVGGGPVIPDPGGDPQTPAPGGAGGQTKPQPPPPPPPALPTADAGADQTVEDGANVALTGKGTDPEGTGLLYAWTQVSGAPVTLAGAETPTPTFKAPETSGRLEFQFAVRSPDGVATDTLTVTVRAQPILFVACAGNNSVVSFRCPSANGAQTSARTVVAGANTRLNMPAGIVLDRAGGMLVSSGNADRIAGFFDALNATGDITPPRYAVNPDAAVNGPESLAYDAANDLLFAGNFGDFPGSVSVYANATSLSLVAPAKPVRKFSSNLLANPRGMALAPSGELYVACSGFQNIVVLDKAASLDGAVAPSRELRSPTLENGLVMDVALDATDRLYVVDGMARQVAVFDDASSLDGPVPADAVVAPIGAQSLQGIAVDRYGTGYVTDSAAGAVYVIRNLAERSGPVVPDVTVGDGTIPIKNPWHLAIVER